MDGFRHQVVSQSSFGSGLINDQRSASAVSVHHNLTGMYEPPRARPVTPHQPLSEGLSCLYDQAFVPCFELPVEFIAQQDRVNYHKRNQRPVNQSQQDAARGFPLPLSAGPRGVSDFEESFNNERAFLQSRGAKYHAGGKHGHRKGCGCCEPENDPVSHVSTTHSRRRRRKN